MTAWPCASASTCPRGYERWRDVRVDPRGFGLHGVALAPGEVVRLTQDEVEGHPAWRAFGGLTARHAPLRGWLATPVCPENARSYGLLQLSDKAGGADFTEEDPDNIRELAAFAGATLDSLRAAFRAFCRFGRIGTKLRHVLVGVADSDQGS